MTSDPNYCPLKSMAELERDYIKWSNRKRKVRAELKTKHFIVDNDVHGVEYDIAMSACDTKAKLVHWISHLMGKNWVTMEHLRDLIECAHKTHGESMNPWTDH